MTFVATLIANPGNPVLEEAHLRLAAQALDEAGTPIWLSTGVAADIPFEGSPHLDRRGTALAVRALLGPLPVDVAVQPANGRRKKLLLADMDSTMIGQECIDELADFVGLKEKVSGITERAMRGEIAFEPALRERVALLKGLPESIVDRIIAERITLTPGGRELVGTMRRNGGAAWLVSGGFTIFTSRIAEMIGFDINRANILNVKDGKLDGTVAEPILGKEAKRLSLIEAAGAMGITLAETMAVGDGANDLAMLGEAGLGVAFHAKPQVAAEADVSISHGDLTALLYLQGYARDAFAG
ncbi:MAG: phosphoserine phosphatase SerB [Proteobacteria bacterium]|nr:phosphoserine phosphatase SerB [Pseudomonadota bacterium]